MGGLQKYNIRDVETEIGIKDRLAKFPVPEVVWDEYHIDQEINDRGILLDMHFVEQAIAVDAQTKVYLRSKCRSRQDLKIPTVWCR